MPSTYTSNNALTLQAFNENPNSWGSILNTVFGLIDSSLDGIEAVDVTGSSPTATLTIADGASAQARSRVLNFIGARSVTNITVTIGPNTAEKIYWVRNSTTGGFSVILAQGSGSTVTIAPGAWALVFLDGAGSGAGVTTLTSFAMAGSSSGITILQPSAVASGTLTLPAATDTLVGRATTDTLSNKTLATPTITTNATVPLVIGGTGTTSTLALRSTSGAGTTGSDIVFQTGNNGSTEVMRLQNGGNVGIGTSSPAYQAQVNGLGQTTAALTDAGNKGGSILIADIGAAGGNGGALLFAASVTNGLIPGCAIKSLLANGAANGQSDLAFSTRNAAADTSLTERMRITSGGNVGIGASSPATKLHVLTANPSTANEVARFQGGTNNANFRNYISCYTTNIGYWWELSNEDAAGTGSSNGFAFRERSAADPSVVRLYLASGGNVGIGTTSPAYQLQLSTDSAAKPSTNTWTIASDARLKTVLGNYEKGLDAICALRPVRYQYNGLGGMPADGKENISIVAQEAQEVFPECIGTFQGKLHEDDEEETELLNYNGHAVTFALINAIKELKARIETLEAAQK